MTSKLPALVPNKRDKKGIKTGLWVYWYTNKWVDTQEEDQVAYYRKAYHQPKELIFDTTDYYRSGQIQFKGQILDFGEGVLMGSCCWYFKNGQKKAEANYHYGAIEGVWRDYFNTGQLKTQAYYERGQRNGLRSAYYRNGKLKEQGKYHQGQKGGLWQKWNEQGTLIEQLFYGNGQKLASSQAIYEAIHPYLDRAQHLIALDLALENKRLTEKNNGKVHLYYLKSLNLLSWTYQALGQYDQAKSILEEKWLLVSKEDGKPNQDYLDILLQFADLYWDQGAYVEAEVAYRKVLKLIVDQDLVCRTDFQVILHNMGLLYKQLGDHQKAEDLYLQALQLGEARLGKDHSDMAHVHRSLGSLYRTWQQYAKAKTHLEKALDLCPKSARDYHYYLFNLGKLYRDQGNFSEAEKRFQQAVKKVERSYGKKNKDYASALYFLANNYRLSGAFAKAEPLLEEVYALQKNLLGDQHIYLATTLFNLGQLYWASGQLQKANQYFEQAIDLFLFQVRNIYPFVSEREKLEFWKNHQQVFESYYSFSLEYYNHQPEIAGKILEVSIQTKGLALESANLMRRQIITADDPDLYQQYQKWLSLKSKLAESTQLRQTQPEAIKKLREECDLLEKELSRQSKTIQQALSTPIDWKAIRDHLQKEEAVVEFLSFDLYDAHASATCAFGVALLITKAAVHPNLIALGPTEKINSLLNLPFSKIYVKNTEAAKKLYDLIWRPLLPGLKNKTIIHYAAAGPLHQIALNCLVDEKDNLLIDHYQLHCYSTLRDFLERNRNNSDLLPMSTLLMGGIQFDLSAKESTQLTGNLRKMQLDKELGLSHPKELHFSFLEGTLQEVQSLAKLFRYKNWDVQLFTGLAANEMVLRKYNAVNSPRIIHLATHGYFIPAQQNSENPFLRSGLALAGANDENTKGLLTALDVSALDLQNTQLVVLSACETGLGDIENNEGVFGLQRAFKLAGTQALLLSLWQIPDQQTVELMELFYTHFLVGKDKSEALLLAQRTMRQKYPPFYWAAFVLVE